MLHMLIISQQLLDELYLKSCQPLETQRGFQCQPSHHMLCVGTNGPGSQKVEVVNNRNNKVSETI